MRTVTEFSGVVVKRALELKAQKASEGLEGEALAEAVGADVGVTGDRLARLSELLEAAGDKLANVRLVRVLQPGENEQPPPNALNVGEFHYVFDRMPQASRGGGGRGGREGGRGGREGRGGPGGGRGGGGGGFGGGGFGGPGRGRGGDRDGGERVNPREVPVAGAGWMMTRAARDPNEDRGRGRGGPKGPRGPRRDRGDRPGGGPGGDRRGPRRGPGGGPGGPRPPMGAGAGPGGQPHGPKTEITAAELAAGGGGPAGEQKRRRRRGGRGRRPGGPGAPGGQPGAPQATQAHGQEAGPVELQTPETPQVSSAPEPSDDQS